MASTESEMNEIHLQRSNVGLGIDTLGQNGPRYTDRQVVANIDPSLVTFRPTRTVDLEVQSTYSARNSAYLLAGWADDRLASKTPWVGVGEQESFSSSSQVSQPELERYIYVIGRFNLGCLSISLKDYKTRLQPHPHFKQDITDALAIENELERTREVKRVLSWYGTMFPTSVELGGQKRLATQSLLDEDKTEASVKEMIRTTLGRNVGALAGEPESSAPTKKRRRRDDSPEGESVCFSTVGGVVRCADHFYWRISLESPDNWVVIKILEVESVLSLFDQETRTRIALAVFKTPLYQFTSKAGRHCLSMDPDPSKIPVTSDGQWFNYGPLGTVLTAPIDGAVPFHHVYNGQRHLFTTDVEERRRHINEWGFWDEGVLCYVQPTQKPGTTPLNRMWNEGFPDNNYLPPDQTEGQKRRGYLVEDIRYYVYTT